MTRARTSTSRTPSTWPGASTLAGTGDSVTVRQVTLRGGGAGGAGSGPQPASERPARAREAKAALALHTVMYV